MVQLPEEVEQKFPEEIRVFRAFVFRNLNEENRNEMSKNNLQESWTTN